MTKRIRNVISVIDDTPLGQTTPLEDSLQSLRFLKMKYIRHRKFGFILFEGTVRHDELARRLGGLDDVISAGFVFAPMVENLACTGHSGSLNVGAGPSDAVELKDRIFAL